MNQKEKVQKVLKKVLKAIDCCVPKYEKSNLSCGHCPYVEHCLGDDPSRVVAMPIDLVDDLRALLKEMKKDG